MIKLTGRRFYIFLPLLAGIVVLIGFIIIGFEFKLDYHNIHGFRSVLESVVGFVSIIIGFYSAFYGMIISMSKSTFINNMRKSKYKNDLPNILIVSLISAFITLILTISLQVLVNYPSIVAKIIYYIWIIMTTISFVYALQTSILSIAIIFFGESEHIPIKKV